jgi:hypothetical protein
MRSKATIAIFLAVIAPCAAYGVPTAVINFTKALPGTSAAAEPSLAGPVLSDQVIPYSTLPGSFHPAKGTVQVRTVRGADGRLNFYWRIVAHPGSRDVVHALEIYKFPRRVYDANWRVDGLGTVKPVLVAGQNAAAGWRMEFVFRPTIRPGQQSRFFFLRARTPATRPALIRVRFENGRSAYIRAVAPVG